MAPFRVLAGECQGTLAVTHGVLSAPGDQICFCQVGHPEWLKDHLPYGHTLCHGLFQQRQALGFTPYQGIGIA